MRQPTRDNKIIKRKSSHKPSTKIKQLYGTSKLEEDFARDFLDKLELRYVYQFEAKEIGRWYDFYLTDYRILIEIDGGYW
jgi:very-short-patch-repair endonuclease